MIMINTFIPKISSIGFFSISNNNFPVMELSDKVINRILKAKIKKGIEYLQ
jgi:hypothetical protein